MHGAKGVVVDRPPDAGDDGLRVWWSTVCTGMVTSVTGGTALDLTDRLGRFVALSWLQEQGHRTSGWMLDHAHGPELLAWSVRSVARGGAPVCDVLVPTSGRYPRSEQEDHFFTGGEDYALTLGYAWVTPEGELHLPAQE